MVPQAHVREIKKKSKSTKKKTDNGTGPFGDRHDESKDEDIQHAQVQGKGPQDYVTENKVGHMNVVPISLA